MKKIILAVTIPIIAAALFTAPLFIDRLQARGRRRLYAEAVERAAITGMTEEVRQMVIRANDESGFASFFRGLDGRFYDLLLRIRPGIEQDERLLIVEADDPTISTIDMYPLGRDIFADGIILMREFGVDRTVLDIEFIDRSPKGINLDVLDKEIPTEFERFYSETIAYQEQLFTALLDGRIGFAEAEEALGDLIDRTGMNLAGLERSVAAVARDNDSYLGDALAYLGGVTATVNMMDEIDATVPEDLRDLSETTASLNDGLTVSNDPFTQALDILPAITPVLSVAAIAGFPRVYIDPDGVRRRVDVLYRHGADYYGQLGFATWWDMIGRPPIDVDRRKVEIGETTIPLTQDGRMLVSWPKSLFVDSFRHLSFLKLYEHDRLWDDIAYNLDLMNQQGLDLYPYYEGPDGLFALHEQLEAFRLSLIESGDGGPAVEEYRAGRDYFLAELSDFLGGGAEEAILADIASAASVEGTDDETLAYLSDLYFFVEEVFAAQRVLLEDLSNIRTELTEEIPGSIAIMGYTGTSTTDIGVNPFEKGYMNVGLYAAVINGLIQDDFLRDVPWFIAFAAALVAAALASFVTRQLRAGIGIAVGLGMMVLFLVGIGFLFSFTGIYINVLPVLLATIAAFLAAVIQNFLREFRQKQEIRGAFSRVIAPEVVEEIEKDPELFVRKGQNKLITAMFTDIAKFSTLSEGLGSAEKVFDLLKIYLTEMNKIIFEEQGVIDKFEGDAIIAFWGAPLDSEEHAIRACRAALRMKAREKTLNKELLDDGVISPELAKQMTEANGEGMPIFTRVGISSGVTSVGFLGSDQRSDYTGMGNHMNLASRLEGVNKRYNTSICISHWTEELIHTSFITRRLDRVRVVNINEPVFLNELSCFKEDFTEDMRQCYNLYHQGIEFVQEKKWTKAVEQFEKVLALIPDDGPSKTMIDQCRKYQKDPPPANWDGVYKMTEK